jgi:hypothetical protein
LYFTNSNPAKLKSCLHQYHHIHHYLIRILCIQSPNQFAQHKYLTLKAQWTTTTTSILIYQYHQFLMHHHFICIRGHRQKLNIRTDHQVIKSIILFNQCIHFAIGLADISPIEELKETKPAPHEYIDFTNASTIALAGESVQMNNTNIHHDGSNCQLEHIHNHQLSTINLSNVNIH